MYKEDMYERELKHAKSMRPLSFLACLIMYVFALLTFPPEEIAKVSIVILLPLITFQIMSAMMIKHAKNNLAKFDEQMTKVADAIGPFNRSDVFKTQYGYDIFKGNEFYMVVLVDGKIDKIINGGNVDIIEL